MTGLRTKKQVVEHAAAISGATIGDEQIRVLVTTPELTRRGGVAEYLRVLRPHLSPKVHYFTTGSRQNVESGWTVASRMLRDAWNFARTLKNGGYDVVHLNPSLGPKALVRDGILLLIAKAFHKPVAVFTHGWDQACERAVSTYLHPFFRLSFGRADAFIVLGNQFKDKLRLLGYDKPVFVHRAPLDDDLLEDSRRCTVRKRLPETQKFTVLFLARVEKQKGIEEALDAYELLKQKYPFVSLVVAGDGSQLDAAVQRASRWQLSGISFIGHVEGTAKYEAFRNADAYLFPSYTEGLPISVLEAMSYGLPVVTSAVGGLRDFFADGSMGFITERRDPETLASFLGMLVRDPNLCRNIGVYNQDYARKHFTGSQIAEKLEGVYRFLLRSAD